MKAKSHSGSRKVIAALSRTPEVLEADINTENFLHKEEEKLVFNNKIKRKNISLIDFLFILPDDTRLPLEYKLVDIQKRLKLRKEYSNEKFCGCRNIYSNYKKAIAAESRKTEKEKAKAAAEKESLKEEAKDALWEEKDKHICNKIQRKVFVIFIV
ncbi:hypothetical protein Avbf_02686 [Armadillidium vulgare]|nr:hypothetical protein Avbf_02686 [Armadillidium vulgare]